MGFVEPPPPIQSDNGYPDDNHVKMIDAGNATFTTPQPITWAEMNAAMFREVLEYLENNGNGSWEDFEKIHISYLAAEILRMVRFHQEKKI